MGQNRERPGTLQVSMIAVKSEVPPLRSGTSRDAAIPLYDDDEDENDGDHGGLDKRSVFRFHGVSDVPGLRVSRGQVTRARQMPIRIR